MFTIRVSDNGIYHNQFAQLALRKYYDEEDDLQEDILIKYGKHTEFKPLTAFMLNNKMLLTVAGVGLFADIKISTKEWLTILEKLQSKVKLNDWKTVIANLQKEVA